MCWYGTSVMPSAAHFPHSALKDVGTASSPTSHPGKKGRLQVGHEMQLRIYGDVEHELTRLSFE